MSPETLLKLFIILVLVRNTNNKNQENNKELKLNFKKEKCKQLNDYYM